MVPDNSRTVSVIEYEMQLNEEIFVLILLSLINFPDNHLVHLPSKALFSAPVYIDRYSGSICSHSYTLMLYCTTDRKTRLNMGSSWAEKGSRRGCLVSQDTFAILETDI